MQQRKRYELWSLWSSHIVPTKANTIFTFRYHNEVMRVETRSNRPNRSTFAQRYTLLRISHLISELKWIFFLYFFLRNQRWLISIEWTWMNSHACKALFFCFFFFSSNRFVASWIVIAKSVIFYEIQLSFTELLFFHRIMRFQHKITALARRQHTHTHSHATPLYIHSLEVAALIHLGNAKTDNTHTPSMDR